MAYTHLKWQQSLDSRSGYSRPSVTAGQQRWTSKLSDVQMLSESVNQKGPVCVKGKERFMRLVNQQTKICTTAIGQNFRLNKIMGFAFP